MMKDFRVKKQLHNLLFDQIMYLENQLIKKKIVIISKIINYIYN